MTNGSWRHRFLSWIDVPDGRSITEAVHFVQKLCAKDVTAAEAWIFYQARCRLVDINGALYRVTITAHGRDGRRSAEAESECA